MALSGYIIYYRQSPHVRCMQIQKMRVPQRSLGRFSQISTLLGKIVEAWQAEVFHFKEMANSFSLTFPDRSDTRTRREFLPLLNADRSVSLAQPQSGS